MLLVDYLVPRRTDNRPDNRPDNRQKGRTTMGKLRVIRRWCAANQKGGSGKSTVATCLAYHGFEQGNRVLLVDADPQGSALTAAMRMHASCLRAGHLPEEAPSSGPMLLSLAAALDEDAALVLGWQDRTGADHVVPLDQIICQHAVDLVIFDPPGRLDDTHRAVIAASDVAFLVVGQGQTDRDALLGSADLLRSVQKERPALIPRVLFNKVRPKTRAAHEAVAAAQETGLDTLDAVIQNRTAFEEAFSSARKGRPPRSAAGRDIAALYDELVTLSRGARARASAPSSSSSSPPIVEVEAA